jgi:hypothetical protein
VAIDRLRAHQGLEKNLMNIDNQTIQKLLTRQQAADYVFKSFGITLSALTLDALASKSGGPKYVKWGRKSYYEPHDLETWVKSRMSRKFTSTSDEASGGRS